MSQKTILVTDDEAPIREIFEEFYSQAGYVVQTAENGEQALAILEQESIEVMFLDLNMPLFTIPFCNQVKSSFLNRLDISSPLLPFVFYDSLNPAPFGIRIRHFTAPYYFQRPEPTCRPSYLRTITEHYVNRHSFPGQVQRLVG